MPVILLLVLFLSACASPAPQFFGAVRHDITLEGIRFVVLHDGSRAEVIRLGYLGRRARAPVPDLMAIAAERTTGCTVIANSLRSRIPGDTGEARLSLRCPAGRGGLTAPRRHSRISRGMRPPLRRPRPGDRHAANVPRRG
ncbi:hypothetical protein [Paracoccus denitrificans]|jgi:hypothetical protein|uniref:hypothetical protein n=1 Tax=Paracoccus denitrificans TaxID=266 RepID=UPI00116AE13B|nr:hypothetical protein [Paracoccus denitrificans]WQO34612.1 hypothetical protein U0005_06040 [Paracoccus denitrificans]GEK70906.1 hypothetical protein PDE01_44260 [Paracoccus denitrificans]